MRANIVNAQAGERVTLSALLGGVGGGGGAPPPHTRLLLSPRDSRGLFIVHCPVGDFLERQKQKRIYIYRYILVDIVFLVWGSSSSSSQRTVE